LLKGESRRAVEEEGEEARKEEKKREEFPVAMISRGCCSER